MGERAWRREGADEELELGRFTVPRLFYEMPIKEQYK